jgi:hypothetical protein
MWGVVRLMDRWSKSAAQQQLGVIDFAAHRCMCGPFKVSRSREQAVLVVEDQLWRGTPGKPIDRLSATTASSSQPLWLVDLLRGIVDAEEREVDFLQGRPCRHFAAHIDMSRAADVLTYKMALPPGTSQLHELNELPVEVWIDDEGHVRRIRRTALLWGTATATVDFTEFAIPLPADWSRLPTHADTTPNRQVRSG